MPLIRNFITLKGVGAAAAFLGAVGLSLILLYGQSIRAYRQALFMDAALYGKIERMKLLLAAGASVDEPACQTELCLTPLAAAALGRDYNAVSFLLDRGANVNTKLKRGQTALKIAAYHGDTNIVRLLLSKNADVNADWEGDTALKTARERGHIEIVDLLVKAGATN